MDEDGDTSGSDTALGAPPLKRGQSAQMQRDMRSKLALKANMARRKAQVRARDTEAADKGSPENE